MRQIILVAMGWQKGDKKGWTANVCVKLWSFHSCAALYRWQYGHLVQNSWWDDPIIVYGCSGTCAMEKSTTCWVHLDSCFLATEATALKPQISVCKAELEAHFRSPLTVSAYVGFLEGPESETGPDATLGWQKSSTFCQGPWDSRRHTWCPKEEELLWFKMANFYSWQQLKKLFDQGISWVVTLWISRVFSRHCSLGGGTACAPGVPGLS